MTTTSLNALAKQISHMNSPEEDKCLHPEIQSLYPHKFVYGGVTTFTAHLLHTMGVTRKDQNMHYKNISVKSLCRIYFPFITVVKDNYFHAIKELSDNQKRKTSEIEINPVIVIHDPRDVSERIAQLLKFWKVVTIRKTVQSYLEMKYGIESLFLYHPFFRYNTTTSSSLELSGLPTRRGVVSISRIGFGKNIDIILKANKILDSQYQGGANAKNGSNLIEIYGCPAPRYVYLFLH